jgi:hypothetical protein
MVNKYYADPDEVVAMIDEEGVTVDEAATETEP